MRQSIRRLPQSSSSLFLSISTLKSSWIPGHHIYTCLADSMGQHTGQAPVYPSTYSYISSSTIRSLPAYTLPAIHDKDFRYYVRHRTVGQTAAKRQTGRVLVHANRPESRHFQLLEILGDAALTTSLVEHIYSHTKEAGDPGLVTVSLSRILSECLRPKAALHRCPNVT